MLAVNVNVELDCQARSSGSSQPRREQVYRDYPHRQPRSQYSYDVDPDLSYKPYQGVFKRAFSSSSSSPAQVLPDDSWDPNRYQYDLHQHQHQDNHPFPRPPAPVSSSGSPGPSRLRDSDWQHHEHNGKGKGKGRERASPATLPQHEPLPDLFDRKPARRYQDGPDLVQGEFEPSPEDIDDLFRSSLETDIPPGLGGTSWPQELQGYADADSAAGEWDLSSELLEEMGMDDPLPPMPEPDDFPDISKYAPLESKKKRPTAAPHDLQPSSLQSESQARPDRPYTPELSPHDQPPPPPPLPAPTWPPDGKTRYDWRARAPSQQSRARDKWGRWFPDLPKRRQTVWTKLTMGDVGREELDRYQAHFIPLLEAEQAEEERIFNQRLAEWDLIRLQREGYAMDEMRGTKGYQPKSLLGVGVAYSFVRGKGGRELPFHRFTVGANVVISRTDPQVDPVYASKAQGKTTPQPLIGSVWNVSKGNLRVMFHEAIPDLERGSWRLDIACSDFAIKKQIEAIKSLNLDPFEQDMSDYEGDSPTHAVLPAASAIATATTSPVKQPKKEQAVLRGTAIRDLLFRAFQSDYTPPDRAPTLASTNASVHHVVDHSLPSDHLVPDTSVMQPSDLDAIPRPPVIKSTSDGILARNQLIQSWTSRYRQPGEPVRVEGDPAVPLNESQTRAIAMMLSERFSLVQGPPGTGKTRVIIETIKLLKQHWQIPHPILVTAHTNVAVDNLLFGLRAHGIKSLRFGAINRVAEDSSEFTLDRMMGLHPRWIHFENARREREVLFEKKNSGDLPEEDEKRLNSLSRRIWALRQSITREILLDADVICTTCLSATSNTLQGIDFPIVFLDEASMATEPLSLVPLTKGSSHVAIIGDHKQLPPVIVSPEAQAGGLATSLFERLIHEGNIPSIMLDTQYRMHPLLSSFPSRTFYSSLLKDGTDPAYRAAPETEFLVASPPPLGVQGDSSDRNADNSARWGRKNLTFLNHDHPESPVSRSLANYGDAEIVCDVIADLLFKNPGLKGRQIGLITPYLSQIRLLSTHLADPERRSAFTDVLGPERTREIDEIEIKTVDGFEGREKEVIIFSCVRSNAPGFIGFLSDWRRVNVALTRARRALIMVGSRSTLLKARVGKAGEQTLPSGGAGVWRDLMAWMDAEGMVMDAD